MTFEWFMVTVGLAYIAGATVYRFGWLMGFTADTKNEEDGSESEKVIKVQFK